MMLTTIKKFFKLKKYILLGMFFISTIIQIIAVSIPLLSAKLIDALISKDIDLCILLLKIISILLLSSLILQYIFKVLKVENQQLLNFELQNLALDSLYRKNTLQINKKALTTLSQNTLTDTTTISNFIFTNLFEIISNFIVLLTALFILYSLNKLFFLVALFSLPLYVFLTLYMQPKISYSMSKSKNFESIYEGGLIKIFQTILTLKRFTNIKEVMNYNKINFINKYTYYIKTYKLFYFFYSIGSIVTSLVQILYYVIGINLIISNSITVGEFTVVLSFYSFLLAAVNYYLNFFEQYNDFSTSWNRMESNFPLFLNNTPTSKINIKHVTKINILPFYWKFDTKKLPFPKINLNTGSVLLITGKNGSGKSTLLDIIIGMYDPPLKTIFINEIPIEKLDFEILRKSFFSICESKIDFILGNVFENIQFYLADCNISKQKILDFVERHNLATMYPDISLLLQKNIDNLSSGQQKKVSLLICFLRDTDVLLLDEPTNTLDAISKECLVNFINEYSANHIIIIISHEKYFNDQINNTKTIHISSI